MRVVRYGNERGSEIELHPDVTVVTGLRSIDEARLVQDLSALVSGRSVETTMTVEHDGSRVGLDPGSRLGVSGGSVVDHVGAALELAGTIGLENRDVAEAGDLVAEKQEAVGVLDDALAATLAQRDQLHAERSRLASEIAIIDQRGSKLTYENDDGRIVAIARAHADELRAQSRADLGPARERLSDAMVSYRAALDPAPIADPEALALADRWADLSVRAAELETRLALEGRSPEELEARLDKARREIGELELAGRPGSMDPELARQVEEAHEEVITAEGKKRRFLGGSRGAKRLEEAKERERELLEQLGYATWTGYVMGTAGTDAGDHKAKLEAARRRLEAVEAEWETLSAELASDPEHASLLSEMDELYIEATGRLGGEPTVDMEDALRAVTIEPAPLGDLQPYEDELAGAIDGAGVGPVDGPTGEDLLHEAGNALAELDDRVAAASEFEEQAAALEALAGLVIEGDASPEELESALGEETASEYDTLETRSAELQSELEELEAEIRDHDDLVDARLTLRDAAVAAARRAASVVTGLVAGDGALDADAQSAALLERLKSEGLGSNDVPIVLDHAFAEFRWVNAALEIVAEQRGNSQLIVITDREDVASWAERLGVDRAAVISAAS